MASLKNVQNCPTNCQMHSTMENTWVVFPAQDTLNLDWFPYAPSELAAVTRDKLPCQKRQLCFAIRQRTITDYKLYHFFPPFCLISIHPKFENRLSWVVSNLNWSEGCTQKPNKYCHFKMLTKALYGGGEKYSILKQRDKVVNYPVCF